MNDDFFQPYPKPSHKRSKPKRKNQTKITDKVRKEVERRSGGACEKCGTQSAYAFEMAHLEQASQLGSGSRPWNIALLCGPSVNTGTCHNEIDYTEPGREWAKGFRQGLMYYYEAPEI